MKRRERNICVLVGTRPEVVKMAPVVMALRRCSDLTCRLVSTGQHREMLAQTLEVFGLEPDADLQVMRENQKLPELTARLIEGLAGWYRRERPDVVLVQGDTTTVLAGTIAAFYERVSVGHVEAGLRTFDFDAPWPEEMNRCLADRIATWCFAPTGTARDNLLREGIAAERVFVTGNTVIDALLWVREKVRGRTPDLPAPQAGQDALADFVARHRTVLVTAHRRESFGEGFERMCRAMLAIVERWDDVAILYPVHLNPNVREPVHRLLAGHDRIRLVEPLAYEPFVWLMDRSTLVLTDSGGVQEEAPSLGKPVLVMREVTERPEGVAAGTARLVGTDPDRIIAETARLLDDPDEYARRAQIANPYGDGRAATRIVDELAR
ncbi:MAG TPA: UDP-N-acetylglucosamine 2-epimerase (non-hydrolyzing), partial [Planctomycetota bacterium]|nr:UDP-N-acetylglucosamine 2-epimerase (non-hydrolyzing) [Planctomycetota bacterium]